MERNFVAIFLTILIRSCYQQDVNVCPIGTEYDNGICVRSLCPETHYLVNGACLLKPTETAACGFGFDFINGICVQQNCPHNFVMRNGLCQEKVQYLPQLYCPSGFSIKNEMCFPNPGYTLPIFCLPKPCRVFPCRYICEQATTTSTTQSSTSFSTSSSTTSPTKSSTTSPTSSTTTVTPRSTTTTTSSPCAEEYVLIDGECRLLSCLRGTLYRGRCIEPVCTHGLVWTGLRCTQPEVITTILEIKNNFITETNQTGPDFHVSKSIDNIAYLNESHDMKKNESNRETGNCTTINSSSNKKCCFIITPRMCKKYGSKWVCFNRQYRRCGEFCGKYSVIYLRIPKVLEYPEMLVIPPNLELQECSGECEASDNVDCSGCLANLKQKCSPYCYRYRCPNNRCTFIDQSEYCAKHRRSPGCSKTDGCFGTYCSDDFSDEPEC